MARVCSAVRVLGGRNRRNVTLFIVESADSLDTSLSGLSVWPGAPGAPGARLSQEHIFRRPAGDLRARPPAQERSPCPSRPLSLLRPRGELQPDPAPPSQTVRQVYILSPPLSSAGTSPPSFTSVSSTPSTSSLSSQGPSILTAAPIELPPQFPAL